MARAASATVWLAELLPEPAMTVMALSSSPPRGKSPSTEVFVSVRFCRVSELNRIVQAEGIEKAQLGRDIMVERAVAEGIPRHDTEVAVTILVMSGQLTEEKGGFLRFSRGREYQTSRAPYKGRRQVNRCAETRVRVRIRS